MFSNIKKLVFLFLLCLSWGAHATNVTIDLTDGATAQTGQITMGADVNDMWTFTSAVSGNFELKFLADTDSILFGLEGMTVNGVFGTEHPYSLFGTINETYQIMGTSMGFLGGGYAAIYSFTASDAPGGAPVPIPGVVWLLSSAMLGLVGMSRRKNARVA